jgi:hypothetical protein
MPKDKDDKKLTLSTQKKRKRKARRLLGTGMAGKAADDLEKARARRRKMLKDI